MITMDDIVREGHPTLREKAADVVLPASTEDKETLTKMIEFVINSQDPEISAKYGLRPGIGLAAPQLGIPKRMIAIHVTDDNDELYSYALFNPKIVSHSTQKSYLAGGEGCLSVDREVPGFVPRYAKITVKAVDLEGKEVKIRLKGLPAIVFQHEIDHLNGIMFYDHINQDDPFQKLEDAIVIE
ncbi:peptide deformylase [Schinkia azotoformans]|uniref:peptide deformylase n=1 Tax=Schinkia azotoformans TaxID=1454 RepID=UPI002DBBFE3F|nr:peptide deformylase [Schinkia azotoformans]MEC1718194.1 peptide deformylase [Schinkia azotoformans]MEC1721017.1 peptide deformylase [Schinkia azotoformans]MEC1740339.1 peptide deformylase [Schinkia azotoformans]MEC1747219.1 peptide deformylase [Schinkia azotoformans]MEC1757327.1 peptide deformylase [Schinkia azotoformans]